MLESADWNNKEGSRTGNFDVVKKSLVRVTELSLGK